MRRLGLAAPLLAFVACSGPIDSTPNPQNSAGSNAGGGGAASGGAGGMAGSSILPSAGSGGTAAGGGGMAASSGAGNGGAAGTGGSGGAAGGAPPGCVALGTPGKTGLQCEPGTDGDGSFDQPDPGDGRPPEADGDPEGELSGEKTLQSAIYGYGFKYRTYKPMAYQAG
jgi:hypothetical protein